MTHVSNYVFAKHKYGRKRKSYDERDHVYARHLTLSDAAIPVADTLLAHVSPVKNQQDEASCTANACAGAIEYEENNQNGNQAALSLSRNFIHWNERDLEGTVGEDAGGEIRDVVKVRAKFGAPRETTWPYDTSRFAVKPTTEAYSEGLQHRVLQYQAVPQSFDAFSHVLAVYNGPMAIKITVYESLESDDAMASGVVPTPNTRTEQCLGGHAVLAVGYDKNKTAFPVRNSWDEVYPKAIPGTGEKGSF
jgi:C1A family cysteine protease